MMMPMFVLIKPMRLDPNGRLMPILFDGLSVLGILPHRVVGRMTVSRETAQHHTQYPSVHHRHGAIRR